jgi:hypothetical protein
MGQLEPFNRSRPLDHSCRTLLDVGAGASGITGCLAVRPFAWVCRDDDKAAGRAESASGLVEYELDLFDGNPIDLRHVGRRHSVLHPGSDARELLRIPVKMISHSG